MRARVLQIVAATVLMVSMGGCKDKMEEVEETTQTPAESALPIDPDAVNIDVANLGNVVKPLMFGAVYEGHRLNIFNANVQASLQNLNLTFLRYPGGTHADEEYHYVTSEDGVGNIGDDEVATKHADFLAYCHANGITPQLIIPATKYSSDFTAGVTYAKKYLRRVNDTLNANVDYWNLGNENNLDSINWNYGELARRYANNMVEIDPTIKPSINWKWNKPEHAQTLAQTLSGAPYYGVFTSILHPSLNITEEEMLQKLKQGIQNFEPGKRNFQVGAWNVPTGLNWNWLRTTSYFNRRFATFVRAGAEIACVWPMKSIDPGRKDRLTNGDGSLAPCGQLFNWLAVSAKGKRIVEGITEGSPVEVTAYVNSDKSTLVVFVCGMNSDTDTRVKLKVSNFNVQSATGQVMSEGDTAVPDHNANIRTISPAVNPTTKEVIFGINKLKKWEIARIIIKTTP